MIVSGLGLFGACCQNKCMLVVVSICLCVFYFLNMSLNLFIRVHLVCIFLISLYFVSLFFIIACFLLIFFPQGAFKESKFLKFLYFYKKKIKFQLTKMKTLVSSIFFCIPVCRTGSDFTLDEDRHYSSMVYNERQGRRLFFLFFSWHPSSILKLHPSNCYFNFCCWLLSSRVLSASLFSLY